VGCRGKPLGRWWCAQSSVNQSHTQFPCLTGNLQGKYAFLGDKPNFPACNILKTLRFLPVFPTNLAGKFISRTGKLNMTSGNSLAELIMTVSYVAT